MDMLEVDVNTMTLGEVETIEDLVGRSIDEAFKPGAPRARLLRALAFIAKRREDPSFKFEDTASLTLSDVGATSSTPDPTGADAP